MNHDISRFDRGCGGVYITVSVSMSQFKEIFFAPLSPEMVHCSSILPSMTHSYLYHLAQSNRGCQKDSEDVSPLLGERVPQCCLNTGRSGDSS